MAYPARVAIADLALRTLRQLGEHVDRRALMRIPKVHRLVESVAEALVLGLSAVSSHHLHVLEIVVGQQPHALADCLCDGDLERKFQNLDAALSEADSKSGRVLDAQRPSELFAHARCLQQDLLLRRVEEPDRRTSRWW